MRVAPANMNVMYRSDPNAKSNVSLRATSSHNTSTLHGIRTSTKSTRRSSIPLLWLLAPLILLAHPSLILRIEVAGNVEDLANLLGRFALDHDGNGQAGQIEQRFDVHKVGSRYQLKQEFLLNLDVVGVPLLHYFFNLAAL
mmetsp:Transcript_9105/g.19532  ORF Transcript_9105/g.19532 Transcript_9105/m.19532 type:complete len:141 (+) Transcript_9105:118-540(+)